MTDNMRTEQTVTLVRRGELLLIGINWSENQNHLDPITYDQLARANIFITLLNTGREDWSFGDCEMAGLKKPRRVAPLISFPNTHGS